MVRTYREAGLIAKAIKRPQGYARPVLSINRREAFEQAQAISEVRGGKRMNISDVTFGLFVRGYPVQEAVLRRAYRDHFTRWFSTLADFDSSEDDSLDPAENLADQLFKYVPSTRQGRFLKRRARAAVKRLKAAHASRAEDGIEDLSEDTLVLETLTVFSMVFLRGDVEILDHLGHQKFDAIGSFMETTGMAGFHEDRVGLVGPISPSERDHRETILSAWEHCSYEALYEYSQAASFDHLMFARDHGMALLDLATLIATVSSRTSGPPNAYGMAMAPYIPTDYASRAIFILTVGQLVKHFGSQQFEDAKAWIAPARVNLTTSAEVITDLPPKLRRYVGVDGVERQRRASHAVLGELRERLDEIRVKHPELFAKSTSAAPEPE
jgi:hypothetical protein